MSLTKEQLLIPRVMCVGAKPGKPNDTSGNFIAGDILTQTSKKVHAWRSDMLKHTVYFDPNFVERFPHLFRKLAWCDFRNADIKVDFVKYKSTGAVLQAEFKTYDGKMFFVGPSKKYEPGIRFEPATEQEYQEYLKNQRWLKN